MCAQHAAASLSRLRVLTTPTCLVCHHVFDLGLQVGLSVMIRSSQCSCLLEQSGALKSGVASPLQGSRATFVSGRL